MFLLSRSNLNVDLCLFVPWFPAFFDMMISLGQQGPSDISKLKNAVKQRTKRNKSNVNGGLISCTHARDSLLYRYFVNGVLYFVEYYIFKVGQFFQNGLNKQEFSHTQQRLSKIWFKELEH